MQAGLLPTVVYQSACFSVATRYTQVASRKLKPQAHRSSKHFYVLTFFAECCPCAVRAELLLLTLRTGSYWLY